MYKGQWLCMECCECAICGTESGRGDRNQWRHEVSLLLLMYSASLIITELFSFVAVH